MKIRLLYVLILFTASLAQASAESEMLTLNLKDRTWSEEVKVLQDFASSNEAVCKTWNPQAFRVQKYLADSCQFSPLLKRYLEKLRALPKPEASGVVLPETPLKTSLVPVLQSGAWQALVLSDADGFHSALEINLLRIALQKSLVAHANLIRQQNPELFNPFAAMVIPRMLSALSGYSQTLQRLVFIDTFRCGAVKTIACQHVTQSLQQTREQLAYGIGSDDFLAGLVNLNEENSSRNVMQVQKVKKVIEDLQTVRTRTTLRQVLAAIDGQGHDVAFADLQSDLASINSGGLIAAPTEQAQMLIAVSILAEISEMRARTAGFEPRKASKPGPQANKTKEEIDRLKSFALNVLRLGEVIQ